MERLTFGVEATFTPSQELLQGVTVAPLTAPLSDHCTVHAAIFRIAAGGCIARHPATVPQILAVIDGRGVVTGADGVSEEIEAGQAVFWGEGEEHETHTDTGLTALVLEGRGVAPSRRSRSA
jgi:mannose-6-phosphate isomerase-like protein (cupin superfamily)